MKGLTKLITPLFCVASTLCVINQTGPIPETTDITPWPGTARDALKIYNNTNTYVEYFYSDLKSDGQVRWKEHSIPRVTWTWDWTWIRSNPQNRLEFAIYDNGDGKWIWLVITYNYPYIHSAYWGQLVETIYWTRTVDGHNHSWNSPTWESIQDHVGYRDLFNLHTEITFGYDEHYNKISIVWCGNHLF